MSNLTDNRMDHSLYLPKQYLTPCQSQQQKWDTSCLIADWTTTGEQRQLLMIFTITAPCRSKGMITPSVGITVWKQRYTPQKQKSGHHFMYLENYVIQRQMNKQSGFNVEQIEKDKHLESKTVWLIKSTSTLFKDLRLVVSIQTNHTCHITSTESRDYFIPIKVFFLIEPMMILHSWGRVL